MTATSSAPGSRIPVLDGLRALAIILVLMRHSVRPFWTGLDQPFLPLGPLDLGGFLINGWMGVDLFFVLSGYLISAHLLERHLPGKGGVKNLGLYFRRRFLRIAPAYYAALTLTLLGFFPFYPYPESFENIGPRYLYHLLFMQDYWPSDINVVFWSLAIELKFYLLAPLILLGLLRLDGTRRRALLLLAVLLACPVIRLAAAQALPPDMLYEQYFEQVRSIFHLSLDGLVVGMLCAVLLACPATKALLDRPALANALFAGGFLVFCVLSAGFGPLVDTGVSLFDMTLLPSLISFAFGAILLGLMGRSAGSGFFGLRAWQPVALISYSLYLLHLPLMYGAEVLCRMFVDLDAYSPQGMFALYLPFFLGLCAFVASIFYIVFEEPFLRRRP